MGNKNGLEGLFPIIQHPYYGRRYVDIKTEDAGRVKLPEAGPPGHAGWLAR